MTTVTRVDLRRNIPKQGHADRRDLRSDRLTVQETRSARHPGRESTQPAANHNDCPLSPDQGDRTSDGHRGCLATRDLRAFEVRAGTFEGTDPTASSQMFVTNP